MDVEREKETGGPTLPGKCPKIHLCEILLQVFLTDVLIGAIWACLENCDVPFAQFVLASPVPPNQIPNLRYPVLAFSGIKVRKEKSGENKEKSYLPIARRHRKREVFPAFRTPTLSHSIPLSLLLHKRATRNYSPYVTQISKNYIIQNKAVLPWVLFKWLGLFRHGEESV